MFRLVVVAVTFLAAWNLPSIAGFKFCENNGNDRQSCAVKLLPCKTYRDTNVFKGSLDMWFSTVDSSECDAEFPAVVAWRVFVETNYSNDASPLLITARQVNNGDTASWSLPDPSQKIKPGQTVNISRTICSSNTEMIDWNIYINVLTEPLTSTNVLLVLRIEPVQEFELRLSSPMNVTINNMLSPHAHYFAIPPDVSLFSISSSDVTMNSRTCLLVSVQHAECPFGAKIDSLSIPGEQQTMDNDATFVVEASDFPDGAVFILYTPISYDNCYPEANMTLFPPEDYSKNITIVVTQLKPITSISHGFSWSLPVLLFIVLTALTIPYLMYFTKKIKVFPIGKFTCPIPWRRNTEMLEADDVVKLSYSAVLSKRADEVRVVHLGKEKDSSSYFWLSIVAGIFYALPALQAVINKVDAIVRFGDQDLCYYNFKCVYPLWGLIPMNSIYSNVLYFPLGMLYIIVIFIRSIILKERLRYESPGGDDVSRGGGVPQFNAIHYAFGFALIMNGVVGMIYQICPSTNSIQYPTAFRVVIAGLLMLRFLQARHPNLLHLSSVSYFLVGISLIIIYIARGIHSEALVAICLIVLTVLCALSVIVAELYFPCLWGKSQWEGVKKSIFRTGLWTVNRRRPIAAAFTYSVIANLMTLILLLIFHAEVAFGVLSFLTINYTVFVGIYVYRKLYYHEHLTLFPMLWGSIGGFAWVLSLSFFLLTAFRREQSPARSRNANMDCLAGTFYHYHDLFNILTAVGYYSTAMVVLSIDDDLLDTPTENIVVF